MSTVTNCLECGAEIPAEAKGLCPKCLLKLGLASQLSPGFIETGVPPPPFLRFDPNDPNKPAVLEPFEFGGYRILRLLGKGGMGAVYEAEDLASGRHVALKVLGHSLDAPETRKRFLREGRLAASINHPNSVYVYGTEEIEGAPVITMELVPGGTLHERVKAGGPLPVAEAVDAILQIISGLEAAHAVGILHRDIKPSNCFLEPDGTVKIGDFGLSISTLARGDSAITLAGSFLGTPEFSSPEQLRGEALDLRADIYSVGMTLYYLLVGKTPFRADNMVALLATVLDKAAPSPRDARPDIPEPLARIVLRCLAKQAGDRPANYDELRRALLPFNSTAPTPATLALRFGAGFVDHLVITAINMVVTLLALGGDFAAATDPATFHQPRWIWLSVATLLLNLAYFCVPEGLWGASLGKALLGVRVGGSNRHAPGIPRALLRVLIYAAPTCLTLIWVHSGVPANRVSAWNIGAGFVALAYPGLLCLSARRRNGFATVTDLLTHTQVFQKSAYVPRAAVALIDEPVAATDALPKIGPYHVLATAVADTTGELVSGYDTRLLRRVWIRRQPPGVPPVDVALRNLARPGRLRWLQGHRDDTASWDAYESAPGTPLVKLLHAPQPWKNVRHWLLDLATEFAAATRDGSAPAAPALDRVWITADGRAKLLDFTAPGADRGAEPCAGPAVLLNQVAISALEGRMVSVDEAKSRIVQGPLPIPARAVLRDLPGATDLAALAAQLQPLTVRPPAISRRRRFGLVAGCIAPALVAGLFMLAGMKALETWQRQSPDVMPLGTALRIQARMLEGHFPPGVDPQTSRESLEIYIAGRFGNVVRDPQVWSSMYATSSILPPQRAEAERIVAAHPHPTAAEMDAARAVLAPTLDAQGNFISLPGLGNNGSLPWQFVLLGMGGVLIWAAFFSVVAALLFRGGLLLRVLGIALVTANGVDASRARLLWRATVAWSWIPLSLVVFSMLTPLVGLANSIVIVVLLLAATVAWSSLLPTRSLPDRLADTWPVPR